MKRLCNRVFAPSSRAILVTKDCLCPTVSRRYLARLYSSSCFMHSSHCCSHVKHSLKEAIRLAATGCVHFPIPCFQFISQHIKRARSHRRPTQLLRHCQLSDYIYFSCLFPNHSIIFQNEQELRTFFLLCTNRAHIAWKNCK